MVLPGACQDFYPSVKTSLTNFLPGVFHSDTCAGLIKTYINATINIGFKYLYSLSYYLQDCQSSLLNAIS